MNRPLICALLALLALAAAPLARSDAGAIPLEKRFASSVGEVTFRHQAHFQERGIACAECHHEINAKKLTTPHPEYLKAAAINCEACHDGAQQGARKGYSCSGCHPTNPVNIADETLSAKVVIHKKCWKCHAVGNAVQASKACGFCHSGKKS